MLYLCLDGVCDFTFEKVHFGCEEPTYYVLSLLCFEVTVYVC